MPIIAAYNLIADKNELYIYSKVIVKGKTICCNISFRFMSLLVWIVKEILAKIVQSGFISSLGTTLLNGWLDVSFYFLKSSILLDVTEQ